MPIVLANGSRSAELTCLPRHDRIQAFALQFSKKSAAAVCLETAACYAPSELLLNRLASNHRFTDNRAVPGA